jgi:hypothetical protein
VSIKKALLTRVEVWDRGHSRGEGVFIDSSGHSVGSRVK